MPELGAASSSCNPGNISKYSDNLKTEISSPYSAHYSSTLYQMLLLVTQDTRSTHIRQSFTQVKSGQSRGSFNLGLEKGRFAKIVFGMQGTR